MAKKLQVETGRPKVVRMDAVAAQESGSARAMYDGIVALKKPLYHLRRSSGPFVILMSARKITHGKHNGTISQLIPPWPEYVKLKPGIIANANIAIGKLYAVMTSRQKRGPELSPFGFICLPESGQTTMGLEPARVYRRA